MAVTIDDTTTNPVLIPGGTTATPFASIVLNEGSGPALEVVDIVLSAAPGNMSSDLGSLSDPTGLGRFDSSTHISPSQRSPSGRRAPQPASYSGWFIPRPHWPMATRPRSTPL